jgi:hypothetical protein
MLTQDLADASEWSIDYAPPRDEIPSAFAFPSAFFLCFVPLLFTAALYLCFLPLLFCYLAAGPYIMLLPEMVGDGRLFTSSKLLVLVRTILGGALACYIHI